MPRVETGLRERVALPDHLVLPEVQELRALPEQVENQDLLVHLAVQELRDPVVFQVQMEVQELAAQTDLLVVQDLLEPVVPRALPEKVVHLEPLDRPASLVRPVHLEKVAHLVPLDLLVLPVYLDRPVHLEKVVHLVIQVVAAPQG